MRVSMSEEMQEFHAQNQNGPKLSKGRLRLITSCTECHKRKQKCDQEQPCRHCARRYPPPACVYRARDKNICQQQMFGTQNPKNTPGDQSGHAHGRINEIIRESGSSIGQSTATTSQQAVPIRRCVTGESIENDHLLQPLHIIDAGQTYQQLLGSMLSNPGPADNIDANSVRELLTSENDRPNSQGDDVAGHHNGAVYAERMKWELWHSRSGGITRTCFGISSVEPLHYLPIKPTVQNAELLQIFVQVLTKFVVSIDGNPSPNYYNNEWVPWSIKTPLLAQIAIYTAACYQSEAQKIPAGRSTVALGHKLKTISLLNETLCSPENSTCDEAIAGVIYLITNEWYWGAKQNIEAHLRGVKEMIRLRGGIQALENVFLKKIILLCDFHIACSYNHEPCFHHNLQMLGTRFASRQYPLCMSTPFVRCQSSFASNADLLHISKEAAIILDDMRFLLLSFMELSDLDSTDEQKLVTTSTWILNQISTRPDGNGLATLLPNDYIYQACRIGASIYCKAIVYRSSLSQACTLQDLNQLWKSMWHIKLTEWRKIPGIFIWILLSANQAAQETPHGRFLKSMLKSASFYVALDNWEVVNATFIAFVRFQRWLRNRVACIPFDGCP